MTGNSIGSSTIKTNYTVTIVILLPAVVNKNIAHKITMYIILTQVARVTDKQGPISGKHKGRELYLPNKEDSQTCCTVSV
jgi:hypothetical protein